MDIKLNKLFFVFCVFSIHLIPFANFFIFETLPILIVLIIFYNILYTKIDFKNFLKSREIIFLLIIYLILFYVVNIWESHNSLSELIKYLIGPLILFFFLPIKKYFGFNEILLLGIGIILLYFIFLFRIPILFEISCNSLEFFISRLDCSNSQNLKKPFLITPEPSYLSLMLGFYLIIFNYFKENAHIKKNKILIYFVEIMMCIIIYETSSRVGSVFLLIYLIYNIYKYKFYKNYLLLFFTFLMTLSIILLLNLNYSNITLNKNFFSSRTILNIDNISERIKKNVSPLAKVRCSVIYENTRIYERQNCYYEKNLLSIINISEPTGFVRIIHNILSFQGSYDNKFIGLGFGSYSHIWYQHAKKFNKTNLIKMNEVMSRWYPNIENKKQYIQNYFFSILHDGGIFPALMLTLLIMKSLINVIKRRYAFGYVIFFYVLITFLFQSTITSPYPWLALSLILFDKKKYA